MNNHACLCYETQEKLLGLVANFFEQGLRANELCVWIVPQSLGIDGSRAALGEKIKDLNTYMEKGQFELLSHKDVYLKSGKFNPVGALKLLAEKGQDAARRGFDRFRVSGDASWVQKEDWDELFIYEKNADKLLSEKKIAALCTYPTENIDVSILFNLGFSHSHIIREKDNKVEILTSKK
jgi:hypothetical protein